MTKTVEIKSCKNCSTQFEITDKDLEFYDKVSPVFGGTKYSIPTPTHCPDCRQQRRLAWRNERRLYRRKCDATGENIISIYSPDKSYKVYDQKVWWSDSWNPLDYGKDFDFTKSFFEQFNDLLTQVPQPSIIQQNCINSDYANDAFNSKNCYLCATAWELNDSYYTNNAFWSHDIMDGFWINKSQLCYEGIHLSSCYNVLNSGYCVDCTFSSYLYDCKNVSQSLFCVGLNSGEYCFLNNRYDKEEFLLLQKRLVEDQSFFQESVRQYHQLVLSLPKRSSRNFSSENSSGDFLINASNSKHCFDALNLQNCSYIYQGGNLEDCADLSITGGNTVVSRLFEGLSCAGSSSTLFGVTAFDSSRISYVVYCYNSQDCFGCVGLRNKQYCILNKQYTKEEYEILVPKIIEHMQKTGERGEFFPIELSPFGYNETVAQEYYLLQQADASAKNYKWQTNNYDPQIPAGVETITKDNVPQDIQAVTDDILKKLFICEVTGRPFRIIKQELEFYKKHNLPLPTKHPDQRHLERLAKRNPRKLWKRKCDCSNCASNNNSNGAVEFLTTYSPERKEKVYCETCYNKEVYG